MEANLLRRLYAHTREWGRAQRGIELLELAGEALREFGQIDTGCFIYRKRGIETDFVPQPPAAFAPWGAFADDGQFVSGLRSLFETSLTLDVPTDRWLLAEDIPNPSLAELVRGYGLLEFGVWPIYSREEVRGAILVARTRAATRITAEMSNALVDACAAQVSLALDMIMALRIAEHASQRDLLTGAWNRRGIESRVPRLVNHHRSRLHDKEHLILGLVDVDNFKEINDTYGHPTGDRVLRNIVRAISTCVDAGGLIGRLGGDEFIILCQSKVHWHDFMVQIQNVVGNRANGLYAVSVGGAEWGVDGTTFEACYAKADERLYANKRARKEAAVHR
ncbi:hypothetical protein Alches_07270 [Alicyclobacillus hesperidum subsp. aegles]|uniref:GGDEF domain-containing protein n=1 Tax=Alicyclobacillus hesperidum TaxID=89784 RepID=UPI00222A2FC5|nr:GGDEF domain-containing protein [Alicyclobacillus hesperidum]GLG00688.1 hypothetical protein Alches_07270 [Alicyclobacillus hesperidum subsp. aegles]